MKMQRLLILALAAVALLFLSSASATETATIHGGKFNDLNGNGAMDNGEPPLNGWEFTLTCQNRPPIHEVSGGDLGTFNFLISGGFPDTCTLTETSQAGWVQTTPDPAPYQFNGGETITQVLFGNRFVGVCGNGVQEGDEQCDDGNIENGDSCDSGCQLEPAKLTVSKVVVNDNGGTKQASDFQLQIIANGVTYTVPNPSTHTVTPGVDHFLTETPIEPGYDQRYEGDCAPTGHLTLEPGDQKTCTLVNDDKPELEPGSVCGNGELEEGEQCDDGNADSGDGCSEFCELEVCEGPPQVAKSYGEPFFANGSREWVSPATPISLAVDGTGPACTGPFDAFYRVTQVEDGFCQSQQECQLAEGSGEFLPYEGPFTIPEQSCHLIEFFGMDSEGRRSEAQKQCPFVDATPPELNKTVGEPHEQVCEEGEGPQVLYGAAGIGRGGSSLYTIDPASGGATLIGPIVDSAGKGYQVSGLAFAPDGTLYGAGHDGFISIDPSTGAATFIAAIEGPAGNTCADISFAPDGTLYCYNEVGDGFATIDPSDGSLTFIGFTGISCCGNGMDVAADGTVFQGNQEGLHTIDTGTGAATIVGVWGFPPEVGCAGTFCRPNAFDHDTGGTLFASLSTGHGDIGDVSSYLVTIDTELVSMSLVGQSVDGLDALAFTLSGACEDFISQHTPIELSCKDPQPHPVDREVLYWRDYLVGQEPPAWIVEGDGAATVYKQEDSRHVLEASCADGLGNTVPVDRELFTVDTRAPVIAKSIIGPHIGDCDPADTDSHDGECLIDGTTKIRVEATDPEPHPAGGVTCDWSYDVIDGEGSGGEHGVVPPFDIRFPEESEHMLSITCRDALGNAGPVDEEKFKVEELPFLIELPEKWSLISTPVVLLDDSMDAVFGDTEHVLSVWTYDGALWHVYTPDGDSSNDDLTEMVPGWGYWVLADEPEELVISGSLMEPAVTPPSKPVVEGWNLIGYYGTEGLSSYAGPAGAGRAANCALNSLGADKGWSALFTYWEPFGPHPWVALGRESAMDPGAGYWVLAEQAGGYRPATTCGSG